MGSMGIPKHVTIMFKNGCNCEHHPLAKSEDDWGKLTAEIKAEMNKERGGILSFGRPFGIHRVDDITAIHFGDEEPPPNMPAIGYHLPSSQNS